MMISQVVHEDEEDGEPQYLFKIYDLQEDRIEYELSIKSPHLIGRLLSGLYTFVDGHIYYNNNVTKIRYDLIASERSQFYEEREIFDEYYSIFQLDPNLKVRSNTPLDSIRSHRFAYIIQDQES